MRRDGNKRDTVVAYCYGCVVSWGLSRALSVYKCNCNEEGLSRALSVYKCNCNKEGLSRALSVYKCNCNKEGLSRALSVYKSNCNKEGMSLTMMGVIFSILTNIALNYFNKQHK